MFEPCNVMDILTAFSQYCVLAGPLTAREDGEEKERPLPASDVFSTTNVLILVALWLFSRDC